jgi:hypothetical protein
MIATMMVITVREKRIPRVIFFFNLIRVPHSMLIGTDITKKKIQSVKT